MSPVTYRRTCGLALTDKGREAIGVGPRPTVTTVGVPLVDLPWRPDDKDRRDD